MALVLLLPMLASGVAAQHMTLPVINYNEVVNALNPTDQGYQICTAAGQFLSGCVAEAGGSEALSTANPISLAACACCVGTTDVAVVYSTCADYLGSEAPQLSSQISAYDYLYTVCGENPAICQSLGSGGGSITSQPSQPTRPAQTSSFHAPVSAQPSSNPSPASSPTRVPDETSRFTAEGGSSAEPTRSSAVGASGTGSGSSSSAIVTLAPACVAMVGVFEDCTKATPGFTSMPFGEQAYCYCCRTQLNGDISWTDEIDSYASTCRDWAVTLTNNAEPDTAYEVAKTFATFCEHFSDVCSATTTAPPSSTTANENPFPPPDQTGGSGDSTTQGGQVTVTVVRGPDTTTSGNAAPTVGMGIAAALALAGFAIMV